MVRGSSVVWQLGLVRKTISKTTIHSVKQCKEIFCNNTYFCTGKLCVLF